MSGHKVQCCLLEICCSPRKREAALAHLIKEAESPEAAAAALLEMVDLVPKGAGAAIIAAYRPFMRTEVEASEG
jgi:hypothetical protein